MNQIDIAKEVNDQDYEYKFSVCTLVTRKSEYEEMLASFVDAGFNTTDCEYLYIDNSIENKKDAFSAFNHFIRVAKGKYTIICHQDILLNDANRDQLEKCIAELDELDSSWAVLGNAGGVCLGVRAICITDIGGHFKSKKLPLPVSSLDENFIVLKSDANLATSSDLSGFHLYGTDICQIAKILGYRSYVIDFNLYHKSKGNCDDSFYELKKVLIKKYKYALKSEYIQTTVTRMYVGGSCIKNFICNIGIIASLNKRIQQSLFHLKGPMVFHKRLDNKTKLNK